jgi:hypothetical protein
MKLPANLLSPGLAERFNDEFNLRDRLSRRTEKRKQTFPGILPDQSHPVILLNGLMDYGIPINS